MPTGRPTTYHPAYAEQARKLCRNGATHREIADILGICVRSFYRWRAEHDAFAEALKAGKETAGAGFRHKMAGPASRRSP